MSDNIYSRKGETSSYDSWLTFSNERDVFEKMFYERFNEWCVAKPLRMLEVGCGTGSASQRIFNILAKKDFDFSYIGFDPYEDQLRRFRERISATDNNGNIIVLKAGIEDYTPTSSFDLVLAIHSLYYVDNWAEALKKIAKWGSHALIIHHGYRGIHEVHEKFRNYVSQQKRNISTYHEIASTLDQLGVPYKLEELTTYFDTRPIKELTDDGKNMIRFFLENEGVSDAVLQEVSEFFQNKPDSMLHQVGYLFI